MFKFGKGKNQQSRADPVAIFLSGSDDILPTGYVSIDNNEVVMRCIHKVADIVSNMTLMLMENGENGDIRIYDKLSQKIDIHPYKDMTRKQWLYSIVSSMMRYGNSIVLPRVSSEGMLEDLEIIPNSQFSLMETLDGYCIIIRGKRYRPDEVLHFVLVPSSDRPWRGIGYTKMLLNLLRDIAQESATKTSFLRSKWKPSIIISCDTSGNEIQDAELRKKLLESYTKNMEAGEPWMIPAGEISVEKIQPLTLKDLAIQEGLTLDIQSVASAIGIPSYMVGIGSYSKDEYNSFIATTVMSFAQIIQQELTSKLILSDRRYIKCNARSLMQYSLSEKITFVKEMIGGGLLNRNEGRNEFDYSPVDGEGMNDYTVLENYLQVKDLSKQKKLKQGGDDDE